MDNLEFATEEQIKEYFLSEEKNGMIVEFIQSLEPEISMVNYNLNKYEEDIDQYLYVKRKDFEDEWHKKFSESIYTYDDDFYYDILEQKDLITEEELEVEFNGYREDEIEKIKNELDKELNINKKTPDKIKDKIYFELCKILDISFSYNSDDLIECLAEDMFLSHIYESVFVYLANWELEKGEFDNELHQLKDKLVEACKTYHRTCNIN